MDPAAFETELIQHGFFLDLPEPFVRGLAGHAQSLRFAEDDLVLRYGDPASHLFFVLSGLVALELHTPKGGSVVIQTLGAGAVLGWSWLLPPHRWRFDAHAREPTHLIGIPADELRAACEAQPDVGYLVLKRVVAALAQRLEAARLQLLDLYAQ